MANKALFLDRDGTLNVDVHYLHKIEDFDNGYDFDTAFVKCFKA